MAYVCYGPTYIYGRLVDASKVDNRREMFRLYRLLNTAHVDHNYTAHNHIGQIGHDYIGYDYIGHDCVGHNHIGRSYIGWLYRP